MFGRKKEAKKAPPAARPRRDPDSRATKLSAFGLMDVPSLDELEDNGAEGGDDEAALEAELAQLMRGTEESEARARKKQAKKPAVDLNAMVADCMRDIPSDEDGNDEEADDDPDLMAELEEMREMEAEMQSPKVLGTASPTTISYPTPQQVVEPAGIATAGAVPAPAAEPEMKLTGGSLLATIDERISNYVAAQEQAKVSGDASRARRFARGLTTLQQLRRKALSGQAINEDDIPPAVVFRKAEPPAPSKEEKEDGDNATQLMDQSDQPAPSPIPPARDAATLPIQPQAAIAPPPMPRQEESPDIARLRQRREEAKAAALKSRTDGDKAGAVAGLAVVKECDSLIKKIQSGELAGVDVLPEIRRSPESAAPAPAPTPVAPSRQFSRDDPITLPENPEEIPTADSAAVFGAPPAPGSVKEALEQRLAKYRQDEAKAKADGNAGKARRLGRICKQYEDAMRAHKAGRPIPVEDLPTPPGFAPIPTGAVATTPAAAGAAAAATSGTSTPPSKAPSDPSIAAIKTSPAATKPVQHAPRTNRDKQIALLLSQQQQFKAAALEAKKSGQIEQAKEYLRHYKGYDKVIEAARSGLPVDLKTLPVPPQKQSAATMGFEIVRREDCEQPSKGDRQNTFVRLEKELVAQAKMCQRNADHFRATGDVGSANKFQQMLEHTKKDLDALRGAFKRGDRAPRFFYEVRSFSRVVCNPELTDAELELVVVKGINFGVAKDSDVYCKIEFPYPKETPFRDRTAVVKANAANPEFNHKVIIPGNTKDKSFQRVFKRHSVKVELWTKGGFLRSDILVGTASAKLQPLETACTLHDTFPLMDGRKAVGGKVEVIVKLRNALLAKQVEKVEEKWLVVAFK